MSQEGLKRKPTAIFSADVAGYSRLIAKDEDSTIHRISLADIIVKNRLRVSGLSTFCDSVFYSTQPKFYNIFDP